MPQAKSKNLNFHIGLLQAKVGKAPKIKRCALVAKHSKKATDVDQDIAIEELNKLSKIKQENVDFHERKVLRKLIKESVRPEIQKVTKKLKTARFGLDKLRGQGDAVPAHIIQEKENAVTKLESQLNALKHLDLETALSLAWQCIVEDTNMDDLVSANATENAQESPEERLVAASRMAAFARVIKSDIVASKMKEIRTKRSMDGGSSNEEDEQDEVDEAESSSDDEQDPTKKLRNKQKMDGILAKLRGATSNRANDNEPDSGESTDDMSDDERYTSKNKPRSHVSQVDVSDVSDYSGDEDDTGSDGDGDMFVSSLSASAAKEKNPKKSRSGVKVGKKSGKQKKQKNRMGQQARRALAERKFGRSARHLREGGNNEPLGKRKTYDEEPNGKPARQSNHANTDNVHSSSAKSEHQERASHGKHKPHKPDKGQTEELHPSWAASQKRKQEASAITAFAGKKIKLSDD